VTAVRNNVAYGDPASMVTVYWGVDKR
jgi:hypothetical protein